MALTQVFSCEICEIFKNTFSLEHLRKTASDCTAQNYSENYSLLFNLWSTFHKRELFPHLTSVFLRLVTKSLPGPSFLLADTTNRRLKINWPFSKEKITAKKVASKICVASRRFQ